MENRCCEDREPRDVKIEITGGAPPGGCLLSFRARGFSGELADLCYSHELKLLSVRLQESFVLLEPVSFEFDWKRKTVVVGILVGIMCRKFLWQLVETDQMFVEMN